MKIIAAWLALSLLLMLGNGSVGQEPQSQPGKAEAKASVLLTGGPLVVDPKDDELRKLLKERYNAALAEVDSLSALYRGARATYDLVADARRRLLHAGLELCDGPAEKVEVLTRFVTLSTESETTARQKLEAGRGSEAAILPFRYERLDAQVQLLRAKREVEKAAGK